MKVFAKSPMQLRREAEGVRSRQSRQLRPFSGIAVTAKIGEDRAQPDAIHTRTLVR